MIVVEAERFIPHPIERVFHRYTDHEGWSDWAGLGRVRLASEGTPERNGVGAVRTFSLSPGLREEVFAFEPPVLMEYKVTAGLPILRDHHGAVRFYAEEGGTRVVWRVTFRPVPVIGGVLRKSLVLLFKTMLKRLEKDLNR